MHVVAGRHPVSGVVIGVPRLIEPAFEDFHLLLGEEWVGPSSEVFYVLFFAFLVGGLTPGRARTNWRGVRWVPFGPPKSATSGPILETDRARNLTLPSCI